MRRAAVCRRHQCPPDATVALDVQFNHGRRPPFLVHVSDASRDAVDVAFDESAFLEDVGFVGSHGETHHYQVMPAVSLEEQLGDHLDDLDGLRALASAEAIVDSHRPIRVEKYRLNEE